MDEKEHRFLVDWMDRLKGTHSTRAEMNRLIMNYLEKEGYKEAAQKFQQESGIEPTVELDSLDKRIVIRNHIHEGQIEWAIEVINELHPELLDSDNFLYFHLQQQQLIEMIRRNEIERALDFAQTHLAERAEESVDVLEEMEKTLALLAFDDPQTSPFSDLYDLTHRQLLASEVNAKILEQENQEPIPKLNKIIKLLTWSQQQLDNKKVKYVKMTDFSKGELSLS